MRHRKIYAALGLLALTSCGSSSNRSQEQVAAAIGRPRGGFTMLIKSAHLYASEYDRMSAVLTGFTGEQRPLAIQQASALV
jgi:thymidylate synthase